ncbi:MAG: type II toxin-antitoxin system VapC family toxin [Deltaproteobacteria bacterium]|nr:type II toxin-antitoxin system VapC family toxin [Deltaproteobacteria bacterium]
MSYLLDTNVVSELRKASRCDPGVASWHRSLAPGSVYLSVLVVGELRRGVESVRRRDSAAGAALDAWLGRLVEDYGERLLPVGRAVADTWGRLNVPDPLPAVDGLLAATALTHDLTLVTRNLVHVQRTGARCFNPFTS